MEESKISPQELISRIDHFNWTKSVIILDDDDDSTIKLYPKLILDKITPKDFLMFAEEDFIGETTRGMVDSLSNAKRAIDSQIDSILSCFGYDFNQKFTEKILDVYK